MKLDCVIEGVETAEELAVLRQLGGVLVQGYYYSPPVEAGALAALLDRFDGAAYPAAELAALRAS